MKQSIDVTYIHFLGDIVEFNYVLTDCLNLSISTRRVLKSPAMIMYSSISPCGSIGFCLMQFDLVRYIYIKDCYVSLEN